MATVDLWPEIVTDSGLEGPAVVLKEQAALLGQKTKNLVEAQIESLGETETKGIFADGFSLISSVIDYRYPLFLVRYPFEFYPAVIAWDGYDDTQGLKIGTTPARQVSSRMELEQELKNIFSNPKTLQIIQALIARARI